MIKPGKFFLIVLFIFILCNSFFEVFAFEHRDEEIIGNTSSNKSSIMYFAELNNFERPVSDETYEADEADETYETDEEVKKNRNEIKSVKKNM